jgi:hypothetical protein
MKCQNKWCTVLPSNAKLVKDCKKEAVTTLNNIPMCQRCFNKRSKMSK